MVGFDERFSMRSEATSGETFIKPHHCDSMPNLLILDMLLDPPTVAPTRGQNVRFIFFIFSFYIFTRKITMATLGLDYMLLHYAKNNPYINLK